MLQLERQEREIINGSADRAVPAGISPVARDDQPNPASIENDASRQFATTRGIEEPEREQDGRAL